MILTRDRDDTNGLHPTGSADGRLEERRYSCQEEDCPSSTVGVKLFVYGIRYIDDIVARIRDKNETGPPEERTHYSTDANYNAVLLLAQRPLTQDVIHEHLHHIGDTPDSDELDPNLPFSERGGHQQSLDVDISLLCKYAREHDATDEN